MGGVKSLRNGLPLNLFSRFRCHHRGMAEFLSTLTGLLLKCGIVALVVNEIRGFILAAPVIYGMYASGGTWMAIWIGVCSLAGIALSVAAPLLIARRFKLLRARATS